MKEHVQITVEFINWLS